LIAIRVRNKPVHPCPCRRPAPCWGSAGGDDGPVLKFKRLGVGRAGSPLPAASCQRARSGSPRRRARSDAPYLAAQTAKPRPARQSIRFPAGANVAQASGHDAAGMGEISMPIPHAEFQEDANNSFCCSIDKFKRSMQESA
jgi:hypothetical protein